MKKFCFLLMVFVAMQVCAQNDTALFYLDANMKYTSKGNAVVVGKKGQSDTNVRINYFLIRNNQLLVSIDYTDSSLTKRNGAQVEYYSNGNKSKRVDYKDDVPDGITLKWNEQGDITDSTNVTNGKIISNIQFRYSPSGQLWSRVTEDMQQSSYEDLLYDTTGKVKSVAMFVGNKGIRKRYDSNGFAISIDSVFSRELTDARFPGGPKGWRSFLEKNLDAEGPYLKKIPSGTYTAVIQFIVDIDGTMHDIKALTNNGYGIEEEAIRVLKKSPNWEPATEYGVPVKGFRNQPFTFQYVR